MVKKAPISFTVVADVTKRSLKLVCLLLPKWIDGLPACVDVTGAKPMSCGNGVAFKGFKALDHAVARKNSKNGLACSNRGN